MRPWGVVPSLLLGSHLAACAVGATDGPTFTSSSAGSFTTGGGSATATDSASDSMTASGSAGSSASGPGTSGTDGSTGGATTATTASGGTTATSGTGGSSATGGTATTGTGGTTAGTTSGTGGTSTTGGGGACVPMGTMSFNGTSGPCTANQNCPTTSFTTVVAGAPGPVAGVRLSLEAVAASTDQNTLTLKSPAGTSVLLFNQRGTFLTDDFVGTLFDDDATAPVATAPGPFHGCFRPEQPLSAFDGQSADGTWTLEVKTCLYETSVTSWTLHLDF